MPSGGGNAGHKNDKKKSKKQLEKELKRPGATTIQPMTIELVQKKKKQKDW